jgi:hypothetical protein
MRQQSGALRALHSDIEARLIVTEDYVALLALDHALEAVAQSVLAPARFRRLGLFSPDSGEDGSALALVSPPHAEPVRRDARFWQEAIGRLGIKKDRQNSLGLLKNLVYDDRFLASATAAI